MESSQAQESAKLCLDANSGLDKSEDGCETEKPSESFKDGMSKNQMKRLKRRERWLETRQERRALEREKRKAKRKLQAQEPADRLASPNGQASDYVNPRRVTLMKESTNRFRVVIDMNFEDYMTEQEIGKAVQQVGRIYALNRHSPNPCQLYITSLKGKILDKFSVTNTGFSNWDVNHTELDYTELFKTTYSSDKQKIVYLSGDAESNLPNVDDILKDESRIFIIGGLVDHNRHKNLCHNMALERGVSTAKLPIKEHVSLCHRAILSTVTVFEIMLQVLGHHKQWPEALLSSIPKRKIAITEPVQSENKSDEQQSDEIKIENDCDKSGQKES